MASGFEKHKERLAVLSSFGKELAKRAKSKCELCDSANVKLAAYEVEPVSAIPDFDKCIMVCENCLDQISKPRQFKPGEHWRCLAETVWSQVPVVQVVAVRMLKRQAGTQAWARETIDGLFLDEAVEEWAAKAD